MGKKQMGWLQLNSFGGRLFWLITLSSLAGLGGMGLFFSAMLRDQVEDQVRSSLDGKVNAIASVTETAETLAYGLGVSATTLHERQAQYPDTYRELVLQLFERRPEFVVGLGLGQSEKGIIENQPWLFPYYSVITAQEDTSFDRDTVVYEDFADSEGEFYPESKRYQEYFVPQTSMWTEPFQGPDGGMLTYYLPMFGHEGDWLGTILVDIDGQHFEALLDDVVFRQAGHFILATQSGSIVANSTQSALQLGTYRDIAELNSLWQQVDFGGTGFLRGKTGYWSYANVPGQNWILFGFVPYTAVYERIFLITAVTTVGVMGLLTVVLYLTVRKLNRRLKPILLQCNQLPQTDHKLLSEWHQQDELDQLSLAFFSILEQLNSHEDTIRHYKQSLAQESCRTDQVLEQFLEFTTRIDDEANQQQRLIYQVKKLLDARDYQSVDIQIDALFTMGRALDTTLKRIPSGMDSTELFIDLEKRIKALAMGIEEAKDLPNQVYLQALLAHLVMDVTSLKAYDRRQPSFKDLQYQTSNIAQAGKAALDNARTTAAMVQAVNDALVKIEAIATAQNGQVKFVSDMIWLDLEQRKRLITEADLAAADEMGHLGAH